MEHGKTSPEALQPTLDFELDTNTTSRIMGAVGMNNALQGRYPEDDRWPPVPSNVILGEN